MATKKKAPTKKAKAPAKKKKVARHGTASVIKDGNVKQRRTKSQQFDSEPANVRVTLGTTLNMGNYQSLRIGVDLSLPCKATKTEIEKSFKTAQAFVEKKLDLLVKKHKIDSGDEELVI